MEMTLECETSFEEDKNQCGSQIRDNEQYGKMQKYIVFSFLGANTVMHTHHLLNS